MTVKNGPVNGRAAPLAVWGTVATVVGVGLAVIGYIGSLNIQPLRESVNELKEEVQRLRETNTLVAERGQQIAAVRADVARMDALIAQFTPLAAARSEQIKALEADIRRNERDIASTKQALVSREEHKEKAEKEKVILDGMLDRVSRLERDLGGTHTLRDAIKSLQDWRDRLEMRLPNANGAGRS